MAEIERQIHKIADSQAAVFITGPNGSGKEVVADLIHNCSFRRHKPFIKINCAALPTELVESELFGSDKGAFTGSIKNRLGLFREAGEGTLLLDELTEMPINTQSKLLRIIQEKEVRPLGGLQPYKINCRIIATSNRDLSMAIKAGCLREDLYFRLSVVRINIPPLDDRVEDIPALAKYFIEKICKEENKSSHILDNSAIEYLLRCKWPGNVRQLHNELYQAVLSSEKTEISSACFTREVAAHITEFPLPNEEGLNILEKNERVILIGMLRETCGNKQEAARRLGIGRQTLYNKLKAYRIENIDKKLSLT